MDIEYLQILAPAFALVVSYVFFYEGLLYKVGSDGRFWSTVRSFLPMLDDEARDVGFYTSYGISEDEYVGKLDMDRDDAVNMFYDKGFIDNPLAAHKEDWEGRREIASLGHYGVDGSKIESWSKMKRFVSMSLVYQKQLHVTLFEGDEKIIVTAHYEDSPYNVLRAFKHLKAKNYNVSKGVAMVQGKLEDVDEFYAGNV